MLTKIIQALRDQKGYVSGEEISRTLKISRAAIWKHIQELRRLGYDIDAVTHSGYRIRSTPDKLFPWEIQYQLATKALGKKIIYEETFPSTMDRAMMLGLAQEPHGTVVCCETQTKGRGRMGRAWVSPSGKGIYASVLVRPSVPLSQVAQLTLVTAVAVCEAIESTTGLKVQIKWPNDIFISGLKVGGILTELNAEMDHVNFVVIGLGINVNTLPHQLPDLATSLKQEGQRDYSRLAIFQAILQKLELWIEMFENQGFPPVRNRWKELSWTLGQNVKFSEPSGEVHGVAFDLASDGALMVRKDTGEILRKISGDVLVIN